MKKFSFSDLCLEVTRRCNMDCDHCMRGCQQNKDMTKDTINRLLDQTEYISCICFTGGEPMLNIEIMSYFIDEIKRRDIAVSSFYIVTNGTIFDEKFFLKLIELYFYCDEKEYCSVCVSIDEFHDNGKHEAIINKWKILKIYGEDKEVSYGSRSIINEGNANEYGIGSRELNIPKYIAVNDNYFEDMFYVNVNGNVVSDCNMSYETQEDHVLGSVDNIEEMYNKFNKDKDE